MGKQRLTRSLSTTLVTSFVLCGLLPFVAAVGLTTVRSTQSAADSDRAAGERLATATAAELSRAFREWSNEILVAAQDDALREIYRTPSQYTRLKPTIDASMIGLHTIHPDLIDEACYIDARGPERARMVRGAGVAVSELSPDESGNPFFAQAFAVAEGQVSQHPPYVSPDSGTWVISNATPIVVGGRKVAILHFETELEALRKRFAATLPAGTHARVVDTRLGIVVFDSTAPVPTPDLKQDIMTASLEKAGTMAVPSGTALYTAAVDVDATNTNRWSVQVVEPTADSFPVQLRVELGLLLLLVLGALTVAGMVLARRLVGPLRQVTEQAERLARGDLTGRLDVRRRDEIGRLAGAVDVATTSLSAMVSDIESRSGDLASIAGELAAVSDDLTRTVGSSADEAVAVQGLADTLGESLATLTGTVDGLRDAVVEISSRSGEATAVASDGARMAGETTRYVDDLVRATDTIDEVVKVIGAVTAQTRLLALNATIEAARAGEHGRGFAVVATEVKNLAEETQGATAQIAARVEALRSSASSTAEAVRLIADSITHVDRAQSAIGDAVERQTQLAQAMGERTRDLCADARAMSGGSERVGQASDAARRTSQESAAAATRVDTVSQQLRDLVGTFTVRR